ncbi:MAG: hypothetical protein Q8941_22740 [Bacteroidota bacterium]|nr:hypothetical protein [Bacteroidota bacterium]
MNTALEIKVIEKFFTKAKHNRYAGFISSTKNRFKFIRELSHLKDLRWELFSGINSFDLSGVGSRSIYVISEDPGYDGKTITRDQIVLLTDSGYAFILVFGEAEQVYYEGEPPGNRYISEVT